MEDNSSETTYIYDETPSASNSPTVQVTSVPSSDLVLSNALRASSITNDPARRVFPIELWEMIFINLSDTVTLPTATCLGLACRSLYAIFKKHCSGPISLNSFVVVKKAVLPSEKDEVLYLHQMLEVWKGPKLCAHSYSRIRKKGTEPKFLKWKQDMLISDWVQEKRYRSPGELEWKYWEGMEDELEGEEYAIYFER